MSAPGTAEQLLDAAQELVQLHGFNAFSFKDLAKTVGIRTASVHYHFATKAELGEVLMTRYHTALQAALAEIDRKGRTQTSKLKSFVRLYRETEKSGAICLCGSLASDVNTLPPEIQGAVSRFFETSIGWVAAKIDDGVRAGEFAFLGKSSDAATAFVASLQGALILSRAYPGASPLDSAQRLLFRTLRSK